MQPTSVALVAKPKWLALGLLAVTMGLILRAAWVTEDAYITLRTVDNWVHGFGLRWNVDERVQGYTHPLWMLLLSAFYFVTRESFMTTVLVGMVSSLAALLVLMRCARTAGHAIAGLALLTLSRSFIEYSTSGLENPLTHLLVALFVYQYAVVRRWDLRLLALTVAGLALNRVDAVLVVAPALLHAIWLSYDRRAPKRLVLELAIGFSPFFAWELFSLFYYGFPVPNTAYAKLNTGLPRKELLRQGATYLLNAVAWDPPILVVSAVGIGTAWMQKRPRELLLALGVLLYLVYVVSIGGDFMLGRFLTLPLFLAVCLIVISDLPLEQPERAALVVLPFLLFFWHPSATEKYPVGDISHSAGTADERSYFPGAQLMRFTRLQSLPTHDWVNDGKRAKASGVRNTVFANVGFYGFFAGPGIHVTDPHALTDPLLARLPAAYFPGWRVGHYRRDIPPGYLETGVEGPCRMHDPKLCEYDQKLRLVVSGNLWSWERLKTIVRFNLGAYESLIDRERYRYPQLLRHKQADVSAPIAEDSLWNGAGALPFGADGVRIALDRLSKARKVALALDGNDDYQIEFRRGNDLLGTIDSGAHALPHMHKRELTVPRAAHESGFDSVTVRPDGGDGFYSVGQLVLVP